MSGFFSHNVTPEIKIMKVYTESNFLEESYGSNSVLIGKQSMILEMSGLYKTMSRLRYSRVPKQIPVEFKDLDKTDVLYDMSVPTYLRGVEDDLIEGNGKVFAPKSFAETMDIEGKRIVIKPSIPMFSSGSLQPWR